MLMMEKVVTLTQKVVTLGVDFLSCWKVDKWLKGGDSRVSSTRSRGEEGGFSLGNYKKHTIGERVHILA